MAEIGLIRSTAGVLIGGSIAIFGLVQIRYPYAIFVLFQGWKYEEAPDLSDRGRRDVQGMGVVLVILGGMIASQFIQ